MLYNSDPSISKEKKYKRLGIIVQSHINHTCRTAEDDDRWNIAKCFEQANIVLGMIRGSRG